MSDQTYILLTLTILFFLIAGCSSSSDTETNNTGDLNSAPVFITDRTGRQWDVTHARNFYGMEPEYFNFGLGVGAIISADNPRIISRNDSGFPDSSNEMAIFGVDHNEEQRAYAVSDLTSHEVFNDIYPGDTNANVAVTF